ncbi:pyruvate kinase [Deinococcus detaillensis]|uniref:pyruvate kinase n=1 Tax=Deinococcus detaillensis TaxID=2592048 RepID=A0A553UG39_9DEIO|nr:pyruvate kinase [Deinococcus detaillensis]TSA79184.1 pyruvate kinase [Deinococcus detaillensis]
MPSTKPVPTDHHIQALTKQVELLRREVLDYEQTRRADIERAAPDCRASARNLIHYLAVRQHDLRGLQRELSGLGLSSLGRMEANVLPTLNAVLRALRSLAGEATPGGFGQDFGGPDTDLEAGDRLLHHHTLRLLGPRPVGRSVRIMVTMPSEAADDPTVILHALERGMDVMRVNCAHDDAAAWSRMVAHLHSAAAQLGRTCLTEFDLAGPKLRTGPVTPGPEVLKWKPQRNQLGQVITPAQVYFSGVATAAPAGAVLVLLRSAPLLPAQIGDELRLTDARGRRRRLKLTEITPDGWLCTCDRTGYVTSGMRLTLRREGKAIGHLHLGTLPAKAQTLLLRIGDHLLLTRAPIPGEAAAGDQPAHISCTLPQVFSAVKPGHRVLLDDGKFEGVIRAADLDVLDIEIVQVPGGTKLGGAKLRAEKGINLPDTNLDLPALGVKDLADLAVFAPQCDLVSLSFVRRREDVEALIRELHRLGAAHLSIVLKIETKQAFEYLPELLLAALRHAPAAVMVARGDLAVEIGFERLAEVQEEILWLCEAAHVPVIWATQVLDTLAQTGEPTRAEVTDAAFSGRAEAVMLNKGPYIDEAITFLGGVLERMHEHQDKKSSLLRKLHVSGTTGDAGVLS